ncbi:MAG: hypothetical protein CBE11_03165 [Rickettsiales bacterium TMED251]|nr:MAG: hypothetical protein CBE11_03165 [Rickettsiales bacterium TMED251]
MSEILELKNITQFFYQGENKIQVLNNINFEIKTANKIAIMGSSGSGKSSLLNIASLMEVPKSGNISILGNNALKISDQKKAIIRRSSIGYLHQRNPLLAEFNAFENIYISLLINNYNKIYAKEKTQELLKIVGMQNRSKHMPSSLSGGEQQRVAIARALSNNPEILVADEPTGNLDNANSKKIINELINVSNENNTALLLATHDEFVAEKMDIVYQLEDGSLKKIK